MNILSKLAIGPISKEIVESVFRYSHKNRIQIMLICSRNQIDFSNSYFLTTTEYYILTKTLSMKYPMADIVLCRDHCGVGFKDGIRDDINSVKKTIECDIENNFKLIHIDLSNLSSSHDEVLKQSSKLINFAMNLDSKMLFEIGTENNIGNVESNIHKICKDIDYFKNFCNPVFYVAQTGSLVKESANVGCFDKDKVRRVSNLIHKKGIRLKEHNADYLDSPGIIKRKSIVDAMNIAPQFGIVQTNCLLSQCNIYGISYDDFSNLVYKNKRWQKWLYKNNKDNKLLCVRIAGHYHYSSIEYKLIMNKLSKHIDMQEFIILELMKIIHHYTVSF